MDVLEGTAKGLLAEAGVNVPAGQVVEAPEDAAVAAERLGPCVVKAQVPAGRRGKAGGVRPAETPDEARQAAAAILGMTIDGHTVERVLVETKVAVARELYAAVLTDGARGCPMVIFSARGGMDVEEVAAADSGAVRRAEVDIAAGFDEAQAADLVHEQGNGTSDIAGALTALYRLYRQAEAELLEVNPLGVATDGSVVALDCKLVVDDAALARRPELTALGVPPRRTALEAQAADLGLHFIELDGTVGVLANGAGLTMTTMDAIRHYGGEPANFLEIGGAAYTKAREALEIVLANPRAASLVVNFCGAFARCDVMAAGLADAWQALQPRLPVFFSVHGTGEAEAIALLRERLGIRPLDSMDEAVRRAVEAAR